MMIHTPRGHNRMTLHASRETTPTEGSSVGSVDRVVSAWQLYGPGSGSQPTRGGTTCDIEQGSLAARLHTHVREQHAPISSDTQGATYVPWEKLSASLAQAVKVQVDEVLEGLQQGMERQFMKHNERTRVAIVELGSQLREMMWELREEAKQHREEQHREEQHREEKPAKAEISNIHNLEQEPDSQTQANVASLETRGGTAPIRTLTSRRNKSFIGAELLPEATGLLPEERRKVQAHMTVSHLAESHWELSQMDKPERPHSWIELAFWRKMQHKSVWHHLLEYISADHLVRQKSPNNALVKIVRSDIFGAISLLVVVANTVVTAYAMEKSMNAVLSDPPKPIWSGWEVIDRAFVIFFAIELFLRIVAYRTWFFVAPHEWTWNALDFWLVLLSVITIMLEEAFDTGSEYNFTFARSVRLVRTFRVFKLVRIVGFFSELRKLIYAAMACMTSLFWAVVFLGTIMFIFSIFIMSLVVADIDSVEMEPEHLRAIRHKFNGLGECMSTLFTIVAGPDWLVAHEPLSSMGFPEAVLVPMFVCLVQIGVLNIVVGVFAEASQRCPEPDLVAQDQIEQVEKFVKAMKTIFKHAEFRMEDNELESISWNEFQSLFHQETMQAYLASHELDISHAHLIFKLCDKSGEGLVDIREFVLGLFRLRGFSTALDSKIMCRALLALEESVDMLNDDASQMTKLEDNALGQCTSVMGPF